MDYMLTLLAWVIGIYLTIVLVIAPLTIGLVELVLNIGAALNPANREDT